MAKSELLLRVRQECVRDLRTCDRSRSHARSYMHAMHVHMHMCMHITAFWRVSRRLFVLWLFLQNVVTRYSDRSDNDSRTGPTLIVGPVRLSAATDVARVRPTGQ